MKRLLAAVLVLATFRLALASHPKSRSLALARTLLMSVTMMVSVLRSAGATNDYIEVRLQDTGEAVVNPGMGWTLHFYSNFIENYGSKLEPSDTLDDWPGLSVIYLRVPWSFLEPQEGQFNYDVFVSVGQRDGTPILALPLPGSDGQRRYKVGQMRLRD